MFRPHARVVVVLVALSAAVIVLGCNGDELDATPTSTRAGSAVTVGTGDTERGDGPEVPMLSCRALLPQEAIDDALDVWNRPAGDMNTIGLSRGESCGERISTDDAVFVQVSPGHPDDFRPGAVLLGVEGESVSGVGDAALWFGGPSADGGGRQGVLSVVQESSLGGVAFRIALGRPDLDPAEQLEVAKATALVALPRFPGVVLSAPVPDPVEIRIEPEPVDQSAQGYVQNLLAREADGEWDRGEGLVTTLRLLSGEVDSARVLRQGAVLDPSASGILRLAREYVRDGEDVEVIAELERLLALLAVREPVQVGPLSETPAGDVAGHLLPSRSIGYQTTPSPDTEALGPDDGWCYSVYPEHGDPCFTSTAAAPGYGDRYVFWYPVLDEGETEWEGWTYGPSTIRDAIRRTAQQIESMDGDMPRTEVWLGPFEGHSAVELHEDYCWIQLNRGAQALRDQDPALLQQAVSSTMWRCYVAWNYGLSEQWETPVAWYLSDVVYPHASIETAILKVPGTLESEEFHTPVTARWLGNMPFFEYLDSARGLDGAMEAVAAIADSGLGSVTDIDRVLHEYAQSLTDGVVMDQGGAHSYGPPTRFESLSAGVTLTADVQPFGVTRIGVDVGADGYACLEYPDAGNLDLIASWRGGAPGESGSWTSQLPSSVSAQSVFVITAADPGGSFSIVVDDVDDEPDCSNDDEAGTASPAPTACMDICDPSQYFFAWEVILEYIESATGG